LVTGIKSRAVDNGCLGEEMTQANQVGLKGKIEAERHGIKRIPEFNCKKIGGKRQFAWAEMIVNQFLEGDRKS
jgi:hypothetical protein